MKKYKLELMDWKNIEAGAIDQIRNGQTGMTIGNIMLKAAQKKIKKLGGTTNEEDSTRASNAKE